VKGATCPGCGKVEIWDVSIHAPVKGATTCAASRSRPWGVSIHAPVKGATSLKRVLVRKSTGFNPRPREGGDPEQPKQRGY